jgi:hypothetical protein
MTIHLLLVCGNKVALVVAGATLGEEEAKLFALSRVLDHV